MTKPLTKQSYAESLLREFLLPPLLDDDITAQRMAAKSSRGDREFWRKKLELKVRLKEMKKVKCYNAETKRPTDAYRPIEVLEDDRPTGEALPHHRKRRTKAG